MHQSFVGPSPQQTPIFARGIFGCGQIVAIADSAQDYDLCFFRDTVNGPPPIASCARRPVLRPRPRTGARTSSITTGRAGPTGDDDTCPATITGTSGHGTHTSGSIAGDNAPYADCAGFTTPARNGGDGQAPGRQARRSGDGRRPRVPQRPRRHAVEPGRRRLPERRAHPLELLGRRLPRRPRDRASPAARMPYDSFARDADLAMWSHPDLLVVTAAGNAGEFCPAPISVGTPAIAKSSLDRRLGGARRRGRASRRSFSSPGPVDDGRLKPDRGGAGRGRRSPRPPMRIPAATTARACSLDGTSMSAPTAAGLAALVREYYTAGFYATGARNPAQRASSPPARSSRRR